MYIFPKEYWHFDATMLIFPQEYSHFDITLLILGFLFCPPILPTLGKIGCFVRGVCVFFRRADFLGPQSDPQIGPLFAHPILPTPHLTIRLGRLGQKNEPTFCSPFATPFFYTPPRKNSILFEASAFNFLLVAFCWPSNWARLDATQAPKSQYFLRNIDILISQC